MKFALPVFLPISLLSFFFAFQIHAQVYTGPQSSALAGSGRGGLEGAEAAFLNPALLALLSKSEIGLVYRDGYVADGSHRNTYGAGAADRGQGVYFPGAIHYLRSGDTGLSPGTAQGELWHGAIGERVGDHMAVGISGFRLVSEVDGTKYTQWNGSFGILGMISETMGVGYTLSNIGKPGSEVPWRLRQDMQHGLGFYTHLGQLARFRADVTRNEYFNPDKKMQYMGSLESKTAEFLLVRLGYRNDTQWEQQFWTLGLGFTGPRLKVDYSIEKNTEGTNGALHSVDMRLVF